VRFPFQKFASLVLVLSSVTLGHIVLADDFSVPEACARLLAVLDDTRTQELEINPAPKEGSAEEKFLNFYKEKIFPVHQNFRRVGATYSVYHQMIDAGFYESKEQREEWTQKKDEAYNEYISYMTNPQWEADQLKWGDLAEGLSGELAAVARKNKKSLKFEQFSEDMKPLLQEEQTLDNKVDENANESPKKTVFQQNGAKQSQILADYFDGKVSYEEATQIYEKLALDGYMSYGRDVFEKSQAELDRIAQIRSELAHSKGFKTYAEMKIAAQSLSHTEEFQSKEKLLQFLTDILNDTQPLADRYYQVMARKKGKNLSEVKPFESSFLGLPAFLLMKPYFQKENFTSLWRQTMMESGFPKKVLDQIIVDGFPREKKNSHAYMNPVLVPYPKILKINGTTLAAEKLSEKSWSSALIYILQNYDDDGLGDLRTAFHEGGHGLDFSYQRDDLGYSSAYGYAETHSTTMESFIVDKEFLMAHGQTREGKSIPEDVVDTFIDRSSIGDFLSLRSNVESAIFDILLWDYDYSKGGKTFSQRALELAREMRRKYSPFQWPEEYTQKGFEPGHSYFITGHFRSGSVRYFGYVLAEVSAAIMTDSLLDQLEEKTGRRTLYKQPGLAKLLSDGIYKQGFKVPFPKSVEKFAGVKFSPKSFTENLKSRLSRFLDRLESE
tara:strand:- start:4677 stop:6677 length:2001 start_codon:yes stop_codon:yes gene_type:complete